MKLLKTKLLVLIAAAVCFFAAGYVAKAQAAGPATNTITLFWSIVNPVSPYVYEIQQSNGSVTNWFVLASNLPPNVLSYTLNVDKDPSRFWRVRAINQTNNLWATDFSNLVQPAWPGLIGTLGIRPGL